MVHIYYLTMHVIPKQAAEMAVVENRPVVRRVVLKIGSRILTGGSDRLDTARFKSIAERIVGASGVETVIVSSGAIAAGFATLGYSAPPERVQDRQAAAAVGQTKLMSRWADVFEEVGRDVAQVLLTNDCLTDRRRYVTARQALSALLEKGVVPIVNENDTVSVDEIMVGDNDNLAAMTAALVDADLLVLLTDVAGVYPRDPRDDPSVVPIPFADSASELAAYTYKKTAAASIGGMATKLEAAQKAGSYGIPTVITSGEDAEALGVALRGGATGTYIAAARTPLVARKHWMSVQNRPRGAVVADAGAIAAIRRKASLLPKGITAVQGRFQRGDLVSVVDETGVERARGLVRYDDRDVERIRGLHSSEVGPRLGEDGGGVVMRPDRMFIVEDEG
jgi:glutamate 5-kinase